jgi:hypothetical protein
VLANKPAKSAKTLQITVKEDNAPIINGRWVHILHVG